MSLSQHSALNTQHSPLTQRSLTLGAVSYLNAKPLLHGLDQDPGLNLKLDVPARLLDGLRAGTFDIALLPVIDFQKMPGLKIVPAGGIGCDGPTLTVRIFSPVPIEQIDRLAVDPDSHTSVALAQIILAERYGLQPTLAPGQACLLIGDKVVCEEPKGMDYQLDLGAAWKELTGMPFVFAAWTARSGVDLADLPNRLDAARRNGLNHIDEIVEKFAVPRGWPPALADEYLRTHLRYEIGPRQLQAITHFYELAAKYRIIPAPPLPLKIHRFR